MDEKLTTEQRTLLQQIEGIHADPRQAELDALETHIAAKKKLIRHDIDLLTERSDTPPKREGWWSRLFKSAAP